MIVQGLCTSAKEEFFRGVHNPEDLYMLALYGEGVSLNLDTTIYTLEDECTGFGYTAGGLPIKGYSTGVLPNGIAYLTWTEPIIWYGCTVQTEGGLIYNRSKDNRAIMVLDFEDLYPAKNGVVSISMPPKGAGALILWG